VRQKGFALVLVILFVLFAAVIAFFIFRFKNDGKVSNQRDCRAICEASEAAKDSDRPMDMIRDQCSAECGINQKAGP